MLAWSTPIRGSRGREAVEGRLLAGLGLESFHVWISY